MNMGIGWPNNTSGSTPVPTIYEITLWDCPGNIIAITYSLSPAFAEGIYIYSDIALTSPYTGIGGAYSGANQYIITNGLITTGYYTCG